MTIDTPEGIGHWQYLSAVSLLGLEIKTGQNYYGKVSVLKGIQARGWAPPGRATKRAKVLALAGLLHGQPSGAVVDLARATLQEVLDSEGWVITMEENSV